VLSEGLQALFQSDSWPSTAIWTLITLDGTIAEPELERIEIELPCQFVDRGLNSE
jgi:hypothetical protein